MGWLERMGRRRRGECPECGVPLVAFAYPEARGRSGGFEMVLRDVPVMRCPADRSHEMQLPHDEYSVYFAEAIQYSDLLVGRLGDFGGVNCCRCHLRLEVADGVTLTTRAGVPVEEWGEVDVELTGPSATCEACGLQQVYPDYDPDADFNSALCACFDAMPVYQA